MSGKTTLIIGASENKERYSNIAIHRLVQRQHPVYAIGQKEGMVAGVPIQTGFPDFPPIHTISLYINPEIQKKYYSYILGLKPVRLLFNPGTENEELLQLATENHIECLEACTLVLLSTYQY